MVLAKYRKLLREWLIFWSIWIGMASIAWMADDIQPLVWPNAWGVTDWLGSSAVFVALWAGARSQFNRGIKNGNRLEDLLLILGRLVCGLGLLAILSATAALRITLYGWRFDPSMPMHPSKFEPSILRLPFYFVMVAIVNGLVAFVGGLIVVLTRKYDKT